MRAALAAAALLLVSCANLQTSPEQLGRAQQSKVSTKITPQSGALDKLRKLKPRIEALLAQLASSDYKTREQAKTELAKVGLPAVPALEAAAKSSDPQVAHAAGTLAASLKPEVRRIISAEPTFVVDPPLRKKLEMLIPEPAAEMEKLSQYMRFLRLKVKINALVQPDLARRDPVVGAVGRHVTLREFLAAIADKLDATWVIRFGTLYLAEPAVALELAGAEVLRAKSEEDKLRLAEMGLESATMSMGRETSLEYMIGFFAEIEKVKLVLNSEVNPKASVPDFEVREVRLRNIISLILFSLNLTGELQGEQLIISRGNYGQLSRDLREKQHRIHVYCEAWQTLKKTAE